MPVSQKAPIKYQHNQDVVLSQKTTYTLPPKKKQDSSASPTIETLENNSGIVRDLVKTGIIAVLILGCELLIYWWKSHT